MLCCLNTALYKDFSSFFFYYFIFTKALSNRNHYSYFTYEQTKAQGDCDQSHTFLMNKARADPKASALPSTPKLPLTRRGPENTVNAAPYRTYVVHSIQLTFVDSWLWASHTTLHVRGSEVKKSQVSGQRVPRLLGEIVMQIRNYNTEWCMLTKTQGTQ